MGREHRLLHPAGCPDDLLDMEVLLRSGDGGPQSVDRPRGASRGLPHRSGRRSGNHVLVGGLQQSGDTRPPCRQLEIKTAIAHIKHIVFFNLLPNILSVKAKSLVFKYLIIFLSLAAPEVLYYETGFLVVTVTSGLTLGGFRLTKLVLNHHGN